MSLKHLQFINKVLKFLIINVYVNTSNSTSSSCRPLSTQVRGFKPGWSCQDFSGRKNPQHAFLQRGSKAIGPISRICGM